MSWIAFTGQARLPEASSAGTNPFRLCTMVFHFPNAPPTRPQTLLGLPVFLGQISGERRTGSEHKHCFIQSNGGRVLVQKGMSNSLLVTCIAVQLFERGLERCMFQQPALLKGVQRRRRWGWLGPFWGPVDLSTDPAAPTRGYDSNGAKSNAKGCRLVSLAVSVQLRGGPRPSRSGTYRRG